MFHMKNILKPMMGLSLFGFAALLLLSATAFAAGPTYLGTAADFAVLGGSTVTNTGATVITGNLGVSPGSAITGFPPGIVTPPGIIHAADAVALQAQSDTTTAYNTLAGMACDTDLTGQDLGGLTLSPGVYCFSSSAQLTGTLTLDAQGNSNAVFIFMIGSTLTTATNSSVLLINAASECGVSWQVGSSATLGTTTTFAGNILALTSITLNTGANVSGRALARNGAVTLDTNNVSSAACDNYAGTGLPLAPGNGSITIVKNTVGGNGTFNFSGAQSFSILTSGGNGSNTAAFASVAPGTYNVIETVPAGWNLTGLTCSNGSTVNVGTATANVTVAADEAVICTFTNTAIAPVATSVPTLNEWGVIIFMVLAGLGSVYYLRKYRSV